MKKRVAAVLVLMLVFNLLSNFKQVQAASYSNYFTDVDGHWAEKDINEVYKYKLMFGVQEGLFNPDKEISRDEIAVVLDRLFALEEDFAEGLNHEWHNYDFYRDIEEGQWYSKAVLEAANYELFDIDKKYFNPQMPVTRLEMAEAVCKCIKIDKIKVGANQIMPAYMDWDALSSEERTAVILMHNTGIMKGFKNCFYPEQKLSRAEAACIINRCWVIINNSLEKEVLVGCQELPAEVRNWAESKKNISGLYKKNFGSLDAFIFCRGEKVTRGYSVELSGVCYGTQKECIIDLRLKDPSLEQKLVEVKNYPYKVIAVPAGQNVKFRIIDTFGQIYDYCPADQQSADKDRLTEM